MSNKIFEAVKKDKKELDYVYYGDNNLMSNYDVFRTNLKKEEIENDEKLIPTNESKLYYENQSIQQVFKPNVKTGVYRHIIALYPFHRVYADTMYLRLNKSTLAFINIIDHFSKFAFSKLFIIGGKAQAVTAQKTVDTFNEFLETIKQYGYKKNDLGMVTLDAGSEFLGVFMKYLNENKILNTYASAGDKLKTSPIERFNRTLRLFLEKYRVIYGKIDSGVLKLIMKTYNSIPHANLKHSPIEILQSKQYQQQVESKFISMNKTNHINALTVGSSVRKLLDSSPFKKIKPVWSSEIFKISNVINGGNYQLLGQKGIYHLDELQPINTDYLMNSNKIKMNDEEEIPPDIFKNTVVPEVKIMRIRKSPDKLNL